MSRPVLRLILAATALAAFATAQTSNLAFEVASVKPSTSGYNGVRGGCRGIDTKSGSTEGTLPLGRCVITDGRLSHLIGIAWQLKTMSMIQKAPEWVIGGDERFNVEAKAENPKATEAQLLQMLQNLLQDRFQLKFHREDHDESGYALVVGKNGPKLQESKEGDVTGVGPFNKQNPTVTIAATRVSMANLASFLSTFGPGNVKDETGLQGFYNFNLTYNETDGPSAMTAVQQQLGLRLEARKVPVSYFVIDSAARPGPN